MAPEPSSPRPDSDAETLSTLPDPRSPLTSPELSRSSSTSPQHPDLSNEVATLSNKLIRAINQQTDLDDTLAETRHELDEARQRLKQLETTLAKHNNLLVTGELVRRSELERQKMQLMEDLAHEQKQRGVMEKDKRGMEQELESLTTALFEEANQMVAAARKEREVADRRSDQLRAQLNETELLLVSHQEQLAQLKAVMHQMSVDQEGSDINTATSTAPSTPALQMQETINRVEDVLHSSPTSTDIDSVVPAPPTSFTHLLHPVLRTDLQAYEDFRTLLSLPRKMSPTSRVPSGSFSGLSTTNLSHLTSTESRSLNTRFPSTGSTSSLSMSANSASSPVTPSSTNSSVSSRDVPVCGVALKETRFYKRALTEDIEPTLRLDTAPGLSWLARRTVVNSMAEGSLVVEPMPAAIKYNVLACSLCGENRKGEEHARSHRFRTSENDNVQRYPLCSFCLTRVRASCDFLGFLRMVKDGHWRADDDEAELQAWEECVRLRDRMFWARIGGGVVPAFRARESPRISVEHDHKTPADVDGNVLLVHNERLRPYGINTTDAPRNETKDENSVDLAATSVGQHVSHLTSEVVEPKAAANSPSRLASIDQGLSAAAYHRDDPYGTLTEVHQGLGIETAPVGSLGHATKDSITMPGAFE